MECIAEPVRVLMSFGNPSRARNPYTRLLVESLPGDMVRPMFFTWKRAFRGQFDLFHVHWPHSLAGSRRPVRGLRNALLFLGLLTWLRLKGTPIVWTVHNRTPHERMHRLSRFALRVFERRVSYRVVLVGTSDGVEGKHWEKIPHGHYRDAYELHRAAAFPKSGVITQFGLLRNYKNSHVLMRAFSNLPDRRARLLVAGTPVPTSYGDELAALAAHDHRIELRRGFVPDEQLPLLLAECSIVALPYAEMYNSGAALLALSADRPVLMTDSPATRELAAEFGQQWVHTFTEQLTAEDLSNALERAALCDGHTVDMVQREWPLIGKRHADMYRRVARGTPGPVRP